MLTGGLFDKHRFAGISLTLISSLILSACGPHIAVTIGDSRGPTASAEQTSCPTLGTEVSLRKACSAALATEYEGCDIVVLAKFIGTEDTPVTAYGRDSRVTFTILPPDTDSEHTGRVYIATISKERSDFLFTVKKGDLVKLRGWVETRVPSRRSKTRHRFFHAITIEHGY